MKVSAMCRLPHLTSRQSLEVSQTRSSLLCALADEHDKTSEMSNRRVALSPRSLRALIPLLETVALNCGFLQSEISSSCESEPQPAVNYYSSYPLSLLLLSS